MPSSGKMHIEMNPRHLVGTWTNVTSDTRLVHHLLDLYFCWEYPTLASLSKEHFLMDFGEGRERFCSSLLVNALLALASRFSDRPELRTDSKNSHTAGDLFFNEAQRLFREKEDQHELPTIQALGIMAIREAGCARDVESRYYAGQSARLCIEMGLHKMNTDGEKQSDETAVRLATFWGVFALDHAWSLTTGSLPQFSRFPRFPPKLKLHPHLENALWIPYTDDGSSLEHTCEQPCHIISVFNSFCELTEIVHESLYTLHCPAKIPTSQDILGIYTKYLHWYNNLPERFRFGINFTPQVVFLHIYYHYSIVLTFRPFIELRITGSGILPRNICIQAADAIQGHLRSYSRLYSLRRTPSFVPYLVLMSSRVYLSIDGLSPDSPHTSRANREWPLTHPFRRRPNPSYETDNKTLEKVQAGIESLEGMQSCHRVAAVALNMLRYLVKAWMAYKEIKGSLEEGQGFNGYDPHWALVSATGGIDFFSPGGTANSSDKEGKEAKLQDAALQDLMQSTDALKSALFWPAPRQPPPMAPARGSQEEMGFAPLDS